mmetsp:Transcript_2907/g.6724  ORF Transcript_2907/g.6724 Transcript_2907/m.6724 type:complete len:1524 (-) Transcript_2907:252-4823(-)
MAGARRSGSRRRRAEPTRYSDDRPDTVTYEQQYGDDGGTASAPAQNPGCGSIAHQTSKGAGDNGDGDRGQHEHDQDQDQEKETKLDGSISHRVAVLPALRYTRPAYLQAAVDAMNETKKSNTTCSKDKKDTDAARCTSTTDTSARAGTIKLTADEARGSVLDAETISPGDSVQDRTQIGSKPTSRSVPSSRRSSASSAMILPASDPRSEAYQLRRQEVVSDLRSDPALTPLFGPSLGLLHRTASFREKGAGPGGAGFGVTAGGGGGGAADDMAGGSTTTVRSDWDTVRYSEFYYPEDYIEEEVASALAHASKASSRKRLRPDVLPVSRSVTVLAMTKDNKPDLKQGRQQRQQFRYVAIGDTAGFVTLYATEPILSPVSRLATTASRRDYEEELILRNRYKERKRGGATASASAAGSTATNADDDDGSSAISRRGGVRFAGYRTVVDSSRPLVSQMPNAIEALAFNCTGTRIAVATKFEVEVLDCLTGSMVWTWQTDHLFGVSSTDAISISDKGRPLIAEGASKMSRGAPIKLSWHPTRDDGDIVAGYSFDVWNKRDQGGGEEDVLFDEWEMSLVSPLLQFVTKTPRDVGSAEANGRVKGIIPVKIDPPEGDNGKTASHRPLAMGPRSIAVHDESKPDRVLAVVINVHPRVEDVQEDVAWRRKDKTGSSSSPTHHLQELVLIDTSKSPYLIISRATLPARAASSKLITVEAICQSPGGTYTAAATAFRGGIRLYRTDGLAFLATYGEGIALHGRTIFWQDLFIFKRGIKKGCLDEREDEVILRTAFDGTERSSTNDAAVDHTDLMLVGVPHAFREPRDLNDRLYIWDLADVGWGGTKLPAMTVIAPPKSNGIASALYENRQGACIEGNSLVGGGGRFVLSTQSGDCIQSGPKLVSEWPGRMYPVGYIVLDENVEYVEDEDELDIVIDGHRANNGDCNDMAMHVHLNSIVNRRKRHSGQSNDIDYDLKKALEQSMYDADVDILTVRDERKEDVYDSAGSACLVSSQPEPYLSSRVDCSEGGGGGSPTAGAQVGGTFDVMNLLPHSSCVELLDLIERNVARENAKDDPDKLESETPKVSFTKSLQQRSYKVTKGGKAAGKKIKGNSLEAMLAASIDPKLRAAMVKKELWSEGEGTALQKSVIQGAVENAEGQTCEACLGRPIYHRCGRRLIPEDYEAVARAEEERKKKEAEEKKKIKLAKKRQQDAQRREAKRQKKLEEDERRAAAERAAKERAEEEIRAINQEEQRRIERIRLDGIARQEAVRIQHEAAQQANALTSTSIPDTQQGTASPPRIAVFRDQQHPMDIGMSVSLVPEAKSREEEEEERRNIAQQLLGFGALERALTAPTQTPPAPTHVHMSPAKPPVLSNMFPSEGNGLLVEANQFQQQELSRPFPEVGSHMGQGQHYGMHHQQVGPTRTHGTVARVQPAPPTNARYGSYGSISHHQSAASLAPPAQDHAISVIAQAAGQVLNSINGVSAQSTVDSTPQYEYQQAPMVGITNSPEGIPTAQNEPSTSNNAWNSNRPSG